MFDALLICRELDLRRCQDLVCAVSSIWRLWLREKQIRLCGDGRCSGVVSVTDEHLIFADPKVQVLVDECIQTAGALVLTRTESDSSGPFSSSAVGCQQQDMPRDVLAAT